MARSIMKLDTEGFEGMIKRLENLGADVKKAVSDALGQAAETIRDDTKEAITSANLPAGGKYSKGDTAKSVIDDTKVNWQGDIAWVPVGFDFGAPGAGGYLITGTPKMKPDAVLHRMYKQKQYMNFIQDGIGDVLMGYITDKMGV